MNILSKSPELLRSRLVQRLEPPRGGSPNPFAFGGVGANGRLTDEALAAVRTCFEFDYMGAAEYEWGAVPEALSKIYENRKKYRLHAIYVTNSAGVKTPIWVLCHKDLFKELGFRVLDWAQGHDRQLRDATLLPEALDPIRKHPVRTTGWLELDNAFFFTIDETMANNIAALFKIRKA